MSKKKNCENNCNQKKSHETIEIFEDVCLAVQAEVEESVEDIGWPFISTLTP